jgi:hypothetical protein
MIAEVMWPTNPIYFHLESPDLPDPILHDPDPMRIVRHAQRAFLPGRAVLVVADVVCVAVHQQPPGRRAVR